MATPTAAAAASAGGGFKKNSAIREIQPVMDSFYVQVAILAVLGALAIFALVATRQVKADVPSATSGKVSGKISNLTMATSGSVAISAVCIGVLIYTKYRQPSSGSNF